MMEDGPDAGAPFWEAGSGSNGAAAAAGAGAASPAQTAAAAGGGPNDGSDDDDSAPPLQIEPAALSAARAAAELVQGDGDGADGGAGGSSGGSTGSSGAMSVIGTAFDSSSGVEGPADFAGLELAADAPANRARPLSPLVLARARAADARAQGLSPDGARALDIARDAALALRLLDVLTAAAAPPQRRQQQSASVVSSSADSGDAAVSTALQQQEVLGDEHSSSSSSGSSNRVQDNEGEAEEVVADVVVGNARARLRARPPPFCTNCCAPLERLATSGGAGAGAAPCAVCGHDPANDAALLPPRPEGGWGSAAAADAAAAASPARAEAARALREAAALARRARLPACPPARVLLAWHEDALLHRGMLPPWPERPERLVAILGRLQAAGLLDVCEAMPVEEASDEALLAVHTPALVAAVDALSFGTQCADDLAGVAAALGPGSFGNRHTARAARLAAGAAAALAERLARGEADGGFALVRPGGHLSTAGRAEGGSLFNPVAVAARAAQRAGAARVLIIDWAASPAAGTAAIFEADPSVVVVSLHRAGAWFHPASGGDGDGGGSDGGSSSDDDEGAPSGGSGGGGGACPLGMVGTGAGAGATVNVAWTAPPPPNGSGGQRGGGGGGGGSLRDATPSGGDYLAALHRVVAPIAAEFDPHIILVSAGFDAAEGDPVGLGSVPPEVFGAMTAALRALGPPVGLVLEGGYNLAAAARGAEACVRALLGERPQPGRGGCGGAPTAAGLHTIARVVAAHGRYWRALGADAAAAAPVAGPGPGLGAGPSAAGGGDEYDEDAEMEEGEFDEEEEEEAMDEAGEWDADEGNEGDAAFSDADEAAEGEWDEAEAEEEEYEEEAATGGGADVGPAGAAARAATVQEPGGGGAPAPL